MSFFKIGNLKEFNQKLNDKLDDAKKNKLKESVFRSANLVRNTAIESIRSGGSGITYEKYNPRRTHTASKPGSPPATDTGFLISNITIDMDVEPNAVVGKIIASTPYAKHLEFGTTNMMARPFMQPALKKNQRKIKDIFKKNGVLK